MARYFFDTSAFAKFYHLEIGSSRVEAIFLDPASILRISTLTLVETQSAFAAKVRTGFLDQTKAEDAMDRVFQDLAGGRVTALAVSEAQLDSARALVSKHGYTRRVRTLDAVQLAGALDLHGKGLLDVFVAADKLLGEIALIEGLVVENPEDSP